MDIHLDHQNTKIGPFSLSEVNAMLNDGKILPTDLAWHDELLDWVELHTLDGIISPIPCSSDTKAKKSITIVAPKLRFCWIERVSAALAKKFSIVMCLIFMMGFFGSIAYSTYTWIFGSNLKVPKYEEISQAANVSNEAGGNGRDSADLDKTRYIENKYGDDLTEILKTYKLPQLAYGYLKQLLFVIPKEYHKDFISGLKNFLSDAKNKNNNPSSDVYEKLMAEYTSRFKVEMNLANLRKDTASQQRWIALTVAFGCCLLTFIFVTVPALLRIEENTRKHVIPEI